MSETIGVFSYASFVGGKPPLAVVAAPVRLTATQAVVVASASANGKTLPTGERFYRPDNRRGRPGTKVGFAGSRWKLRELRPAAGRAP